MNPEDGILAESSSEAAVQAYVDLAHAETDQALREGVFGIAQAVVGAAFRIGYVYGIPAEEAMTPRYSDDIAYDLSSFSRLETNSQVIANAVRHLGNITAYFAMAAGVATDDMARRRIMHHASINILYKLLRIPSGEDESLAGIAAILENEVESARIGVRLLRRYRAAGANMVNVDDKEAGPDINTLADPTLTEHLVIANELSSTIRALPESVRDEEGIAVNVRQVIAALAVGYEPQELVNHGIANEQHITFAMGYLASITGVELDEYVGRWSARKHAARFTKKPIIEQLHAITRGAGSIEHIFGIIQSAGLSAPEAAITLKEFGYFMPGERMAEFYINHDIPQYQYLLTLKSAVDKLVAANSRTHESKPAAAIRSMVDELEAHLNMQHVVIPGSMDETVRAIARIRAADPKRYNMLPLKPRHRALVEHALGQLAFDGHVDLDQLRISHRFGDEVGVRSALQRTLGKLANRKQMLNNKGRRFQTGSVMASITTLPREQALAALSFDDRLQQLYLRATRQDVDGVISEQPQNKRFLYEIYYALNPAELEKRLQRAAQERSMPAAKLRAYLLATPMTKPKLAHAAKVLGMTANEVNVWLILLHNDGRRRVYAESHLDSQ